MARYEHTITFVTELKDGDSTSARLAALPDETRAAMFNQGLINLFIKDSLDRINATGTWAKVSVL